MKDNQSQLNEFTEQLKNISVNTDLIYKPIPLLDENSGASTLNESMMIEKLSMNIINPLQDKFTETLHNKLNENIGQINQQYNRNN